MRKLFFPAILLLLLLASCHKDSGAVNPKKTDTIPPAQRTYTVSTLAGDGERGYQNGVGTAAEFGYPVGIAFSGGNLFLVDETNYLIRKITLAGAVSTYAGDGSDSDTDGPLLSAEFNEPVSITADKTGNLFIGEQGLPGAVRKISASGTVSIYAGDLGADATFGGYNDGPALSAIFYDCDGLAADAAGNVYVADEYHSTIRKITTGSIVSTLAGDSTMTGFVNGTGLAAQFNAVGTMAIDASGNLYVVDQLSTASVIRKITPAGVVSTFYNGTTKIFPMGMAVDAFGYLFIADANSNSILYVSPTGTVTTVAGDGKAGYNDGAGLSAEFSGPKGIAFDTDGNLYVVDNGNYRIRKITIK